jgi:acylglycerol lipase
MRVRALAAALVLLLLQACAPTLQPMGPPVALPRLSDDAVLTADGARLPLARWLPAGGEPRAVVLALHGFNDYANAFAMPGAWLAERGVAVYAYDQRGFGRGPRPGIWAGTPTLVADFEAAARLVRGRHPGVPFFVLGESMGGAVILTALEARRRAAEGAPAPGLADVRPAAIGPPPPPARRPEDLADGVILSAPAVWASATMPPHYRLALWLTRNTVPWLVLEPPRGLDIWATDDIEVLRGLGRDPLVRKSNRVDTVAGLTDLMGAAYRAMETLDGPPTLILYGEQEQVIPPAPIAGALASLPPDPDRTVAVYPDGFHMLLRDLQREVVYRDLLSWIEDPSAPLPSGAAGRPWPGPDAMPEKRRPPGLPQG